jgi:hypothetical protein
MKNYMCLLFTAFLLLCTNTVSAQRVRGGAGFFKGGYSYAPGSGNTFNKIAPAGINGFTNNYALIGGEGYYKGKNIVLSLEGTVAAQKDRAAGNVHAENFVYAGHLRLGFIVSESKNCWIYPSIGSGTAAIALNTYTKASSSEKAQNLENKILVSPSFDIGLNADYILSRVPDKKAYGALLMGLRTGYRFSFRNDNWRNGDWDKLNGLPAYANNGFYVTVAIGGGGFVKK